MSFNPAWHAIGEVDLPLSQDIIDEVSAVLFAPDPPQNELDQVEICVVLGSRNCGYKAERAAELFASNPEVRFIACGANISVSGRPEAELIRDVLVEAGVATERVILEDHSTNTGWNLRHAAELITERLGDPRRKRIAVLSSGFHRLHVLASLPAELRHSLFVSAAGPTASKDIWHTNPLGRAVVLHELLRPGFSRAT